MSSELKIVRFSNGAPPEAQSIRAKVFQDEMSIPSELDFDQHDAVSHHWVAYVSSVPVGTARLLVKDNGTAQIARVAVLQQSRSLGIGGKILSEIEQFASNLGLLSVELTADVTKRGWYENRDYEAVGEGYFMSPNIPMIQLMRKQLMKKG